MSRRTIVSLSLIAADQAHLGDAVQQAATWGVDRLHIDVEDGTFTPRFGLSARAVADLRPVSRLPFEAHLMVIEPERHARRFVEAGCESVAVHVEACPYLRRTVLLIREWGASPGVALNPVTPLDSVEYAFDLIDRLVILTTEPDEAGEAFIPGMVDKVRQARELAANRPLEILVDGGVAPDNAAALLDLGADGFVAGRAVWQAAHPSSVISRLRAVKR